jgi:hypothetical protein
MKISNRLYKKHGANTVILPPPPESGDLGDQKIDIEQGPLPANPVSPFLSQFVLEEGDDALDPSTFEAYEPDVTRHRQIALPEEIKGDPKEIQRLLEQLRNPANEYGGPTENPAQSQMPTLPPQRPSGWRTPYMLEEERNQLHYNERPGKFHPSQNVGPEVSTIAPPKSSPTVRPGEKNKKANSIDKLVKLCEEFQTRTEMLPPPMEHGQGLNIKAPSGRPLSEKDLELGRDVSIWDDFVPERDLEQEDLLRGKRHQAEVDELTWQVQKYLGEHELEKQNDIPTELIPPAPDTDKVPDTIQEPSKKVASADQLLGLCVRFNDLCSKF